MQCSILEDLVESCTISHSELSPEILPLHTLYVDDLSKGPDGSTDANRFPVLVFSRFLRGFLDSVLAGPISDAAIQSDG